MTDRSICLVIALVLGGLCYLFVDGTQGNYVELTHYRDFDQWPQSPGRLKSMEVKLASSGKSTGYMVACEYSFAFEGKTYTSTTCDLGSPPLLSADTAKATAEAMLGITGRGNWQAVRHGKFDGWALDPKDLADMPIPVRHSAHHPSASTLTATEPMPAWLYWPLIALTAVLGALSGVGCLFFLFLTWAVGASGDYLDDPHWTELLFRDHPKRQLREWARSLRYFRFIRGSGGGMDDHGDWLMVALKAKTQQDVEQIFAALGVSARPLPPIPASGSGSYLAFEESLTRRSDAPAPESPAPGLILIEGTRVCAYLTYSGRLELSITDSQKTTEVTQAAVDSARAIEVHLSRLADRIIDPPQDDRHCICPAFYPSFWEDKKKPRTAISLTDAEASAEKKRNQAFLIACIGATLLFLAAGTWRDLTGVTPASDMPVNIVSAYLNDAGGLWLAVGVFVVPGMLFLLQARSTYKAAKRETRKRARHRSVI